MGIEKNIWRFRSILDIWVKIYNEMVEMYVNLFGYIYVIKDIDNMI